MNHYLKSDLRHYLRNAHLTLFVVPFYLKFGFYGWHHLLSLILLQYALIPLDDWLDADRPFPLYVLPMLAVAAYFYPLVTALALLGDIIVNLRVITRSTAFIVERLEGLGNVFAAVTPLTLPVGLHNPELYIAAGLFTLFADSIHKLGDNESTHPKAMWISGLGALGVAGGVFYRPTAFFFVALAGLIISMIPFMIIPAQYRKVYARFWFGLSGLIAFSYYLFGVL